MSDALDKAITEARAELGKPEVDAVDWDAVESGMFARIEREQRAERAQFVPRHRPGWAAVAVGFAAAAAVVAVLAGKTGESLDLAMTRPESAGTVDAVDPEGREGALLVDGKVAVRGTELRLGDVLETREARATINRPGKLTMTLEAGSRAVVTHVHGALVFGLVDGAIEAQVVPVAAGEAFAVDVEGTRVAVHGTHLRVARAGDRVAVDLNEGVVVIGEAPREGSVVGTLVNAPAHIEFASSNLAATLIQTHDPLSVRAAARQRFVAVIERPTGALRPEASTRRPPSLSDDPRNEGRASPAPASVPKPAAAVSATGATRATGATGQGVGVAAPERPTEDVVIDAVRACMAEHPHTDNVTLVVNTTLRLELADDGTVRSARFDPPVARDVNTCSANAIYRARFAHGGAMAIPVDFTN